MVIFIFSVRHVLYCSDGAARIFGNCQLFGVLYVRLLGVVIDDFCSQPRTIETRGELNPRLQEIMKCEADMSTCVFQLGYRVKGDLTRWLTIALQWLSALTKSSYLRGVIRSQGRITRVGVKHACTGV